MLNDPIKGPVFKAFEQTEAFKRLTDAQRNELYQAFTDAHYTGNESDRAGISAQKVEVLKQLRKKMRDLGFSDAETDAAISKFSSKTESAKRTVEAAPEIEKFSKESEYLNTLKANPNLQVVTSRSKFQILEFTKPGERDPTFKFTATVHPDGYVSMNALLVSDGARSTNLNNIVKLYNSALQHFENQGTTIKGVKDSWTRDAHQNTVLNQFNELINKNKLSPEEAAKRTITGKLAAMHGFTQVRVEFMSGSPGDAHWVRVYFTKPLNGN